MFCFWEMILSLGGSPIAQFSGIQFVIIPADWVFADVFVYLVIIVTIAYDVIIERTLPYLFIEWRQYPILEHFNIFNG